MALLFFVNGRRIEDANVDPEETLLYYLRNSLFLCGTKLGCGEGTVEQSNLSDSGRNPFKNGLKVENQPIRRGHPINLSNHIPLERKCVREDPSVGGNG